MRVFPVVLKRTVEIMLIVVTLVIAAVLVWQATRVLLPHELVQQIQTKARLGLGLPAHPPVQLPLAVTDALDDHQATAAWVKQCMGSPSLKQLSVETQLLLQGFSLHPNIVPPTPPLAPVPALYARVLTLSKSLIWKRWSTDEQLWEAYGQAKVSAYASIIIGLLTTVFVGLNGMAFVHHASKLGNKIKIAALALPALGTAIAAITAFHDPSGTLAHHRHAATGMQQLHDQIASAVWKFPCAGSGADALPEEIEQNLEGWSLRLRDLTSNATGSPAGEGGPGTSGGSTGTHEKGAAK